MLEVLENMDGLNGMEWLRSKGYQESEIIGLAAFSNKNRRPEKIFENLEGAKGDCVVTLTQHKCKDSQQALYSIELVNPGDQKMHTAFYEALEEADYEFRGWIVTLYDESRYSYFDPALYELKLQELLA